MATGKLATEKNGQLVEAPGTAPGSEWFIPMSIYRHSERIRKSNIIIMGGKKKVLLVKRVSVL